MRASAWDYLRRRLCGVTMALSRVHPLWTPHCRGPYSTRDLGSRDQSSRDFISPKAANFTLFAFRVLAALRRPGGEMTPTRGARFVWNSFRGVGGVRGGGGEKGGRHCWLPRWGGSWALISPPLPHSQRQGKTWP